MEEAFLDLYIEARERPPKRVILEFDASDDGVRPSASLRGDRPLSEAGPPRQQTTGSAG